MAGRPRTMAKRVDSLLVKSAELYNEFFAVMPATYRDRPTSDPVSEAWNEALTQLGYAYHSVNGLLELLQAKVPAPPRR